MRATYGVRYFGAGRAIARSGNRARAVHTRVAAARSSSAGGRGFPQPSPASPAGWDLVFSGGPKELRAARQTVPPPHASFHHHVSFWPPSPAV